MTNEMTKWFAQVVEGDELLGGKIEALVDQAQGRLAEGAITERRALVDIELGITDMVFSATDGMVGALDPDTAFAGAMVEYMREMLNYYELAKRLLRQAQNDRQMTI